MTSVREALREATHAAHDRLDALVASLNLKNRSDYQRFLALHACVLPTLERQLFAKNIARLVPGWPQHRREAALLADCAELGCTLPEAIEVPLGEDEAALLGAAYVLEGSRLGGQFLARDASPDLPHRFLRPEGGAAPFPEVIAALERFLYSFDHRKRAIDSAEAVFDAYMRAGKSVGLNG